MTVRRRQRASSWRTLPSVTPHRFVQAYLECSFAFDVREGERPDRRSFLVGDRCRIPSPHRLTNFFATFLCVQMIIGFNVGGFIRKLAILDDLAKPL